MAAQEEKETTTHKDIIEESTTGRIHDEIEESSTGRIHNNAQTTSPVVDATSYTAAAEEDERSTVELADINQVEQVDQVDQVDQVEQADQKNKDKVRQLFMEIRNRTAADKLIPYWIG